MRAFYEGPLKFLPHVHHVLNYRNDSALGAIPHFTFFFFLHGRRYPFTFVPTVFWLGFDSMVLCYVTWLDMTLRDFKWLMTGPLILDISLHMHVHEAIWQKQNPACWLKYFDYSKVKPAGCKFVVLVIIRIHRSIKYYQVRKLSNILLHTIKSNCAKPLSE